MKIRNCCGALALVQCALPLSWAVKVGDSVPDIAYRNCSGTDVQLSTYHGKRYAVILAQAPGASLAPAVLDETCRTLAAINTEVLLLAGDTAGSRRFLEGAPGATFLVDLDGVVRRVFPSQALTGSGLANFVKVWKTGKVVFESTCARCHGAEGDLTTCEDVKRLVGIGRRLTDAQIREKLRMAPINDQYLIRSQFFTKEEVDAVIVYVAGL